MYCGGQGVYLYYLAHEFLKLGHQVSIITGPPYPDVPEGAVLYKLPSTSKWHAQPSKIKTPIDFYEYFASRCGFFPEPFSFTIRAYYKLKKIFKNQRFHVIHDNLNLGYGLLLMKSFKIPILSTIHHPLIIDKIEDFAQAKDWKEKWRRTKFYTFLIMQGIVSRRLDKVITPSISSAREVERFLKVPPQKIKVIYLGIDTSVFKRKEIAKEPNSLLMVSNTEDRKKGVIYLLKALLLLKGNTPVKLTIVDDGSDDRYAPGLVKEYGLEDMVTFTGKVSVDKLVEYYSKSEIVVLPSLYEGFGFPAAEAMACEVPVIATTAGALPEVVVDGETGIMVPPRDPYALAKAIKRLLADEPLRIRLGKEGRKRIERFFRWERTAKETLEVYEELNESFAHKYALPPF